MWPKFTISKRMQFDSHGFQFLVDMLKGKKLDTSKVFQISLIFPDFCANLQNNFPNQMPNSPTFP